MQKSNNDIQKEILNYFKKIQREFTEEGLIILGIFGSQGCYCWTIWSFLDLMILKAAMLSEILSPMTTTLLKYLR